MGNSGEALRGRLDEAILDRFLDYAVRVTKLAAELDKLRCPPRITSQLVGSGTSPGAQMHEAHEAMSAAYFKKSVSIAAKELSETRFWLCLVARMEWLPESRLSDLIDETVQLMKITKAMAARTRGHRK
ncbi:MAG: four helix bundle protein [Planctomycetota bacterium]